MCGVECMLLLPIIVVASLSNGLNFCVLQPFSLIRDLRKQNTRGNVSKISVSLACY